MKPKSGDILTISAEESHHLISVLRLKAGEKVTVFDGLGLSFEAQIAPGKHPKGAKVIIEKETNTPKKALNAQSPRLRLTLAVALAKGKVLETIIKHATALGVENIIPLKTKRTEINNNEKHAAKKLEKWEKTAIEACKQSGNLLLPTIKPILLFTEFIQAVTENEDLKLIASLEADSIELKTLKKENKNEIIWLIGPEGDFTPEEYQQAKQAGFIPVSLGNHVLRVETAAITALAFSSLFFK